MSSSNTIAAVIVLSSIVVSFIILNIFGERPRDIGGEIAVEEEVAVTHTTPPQPPSARAKMPETIDTVHEFLEQVVIASSSAEYFETIFKPDPRTAGFHYYGNMSSSNLSGWIDEIFAIKMSGIPSGTTYSTRFLTDTAPYTLGGFGFRDERSRHVVPLIADENGLLGTLIDKRLGTDMQTSVSWKPEYYYDWESDELKRVEHDRLYLLMFLSYGPKEDDYRFLHSFIVVQNQLDGYASLAPEEREGGAFAIRTIEVPTPAGRIDYEKFISFITRDNREFVVERLPRSISQSTTFFPTYCYRDTAEDEIVCHQLTAGVTTSGSSLPELNDVILIDPQTLQVSNRHLCEDVGTPTSAYWEDACISFYTAPISDPSQVTPLAVSIPSPEFRQTTLLEVTNENYALLTETIQYECRQRYEKYFYDLSAGKKITTLATYDNGCAIESPEGIAETKKIEDALAQDRKQYFQKNINTHDQACFENESAKIQLIRSLMNNPSQRLLGCW